MEKQFIYIVYEFGGSYEDYYKKNLKAFFDLNKAEKYVDKLELVLSTEIQTKKNMEEQCFLCRDGLCKKNRCKKYMAWDSDNEMCRNYYVYDEEELPSGYDIEKIEMEIE